MLTRVASPPGRTTSGSRNPVSSPGAPARRRATCWLVAALGAVLVQVAVPATAGTADAPPQPTLTRAEGGGTAAEDERRSRKLRRTVGFSPGFDIMYADAASLREQLRGMRALGARRLRIDVSWALVEQSPGNFDWRHTDRVVAAARAAGLKVLGVLCYVPDWANDEASVADPANLPGFAAFAGRAAGRYAGSVHAWEIWNEPNLDRFWEDQPNPADYARVVDAAARRIRDAAPRAKVVAGALAPAVDADDGSEVAPETFVREFYAAGPDRALFDAFSVHPYSYPAMPDGDEGWNTFHKLPELHRLMARAGDAATPLWLTEYGAPTGRSDRSVSAKKQARMLVGALREARRLRFVGPIYYYSFRDRERAPEDAEANFGVTRHSGKPKAAYWALRRVLHGRNR